MILYLISILIFLSGIYAIAVKRNIIKLMIGLILCEHSAALILFLAAKSGPHQYGPEAVASTLIICGLAQAIMLFAFALKVFRLRGDVNASEMKELKG